MTAPWTVVDMDLGFAGLRVDCQPGSARPAVLYIGDPDGHCQEDLSSTQAYTVARALLLAALPTGKGVEVSSTMGWWRDAWWEWMSVAGQPIAMLRVDPQPPPPALPLLGGRP